MLWIFLRAIIGLFFGFLIHYKTYKKSILYYKTNLLVIKNIHKKLKIYGRLFDKKTGLNLDFSFGEMAMEICELLGEGKESCYFHNVSVIF